jgi:hypothetical protein
MVFIYLDTGRRFEHDNVGQAEHVGRQLRVYLASEEQAEVLVGHL